MGILEAPLPKVQRKDQVEIERAYLGLKLGVKVNDIARSWLQKEALKGRKKMESSQAASGSERDTELSSEKKETM